MDKDQLEFLIKAAERLWDIVTICKASQYSELRPCRKIAKLADEALMDMASGKVPIPMLPQDPLSPRTV